MVRNLAASCALLFRRDAVSQDLRGRADVSMLSSVLPPPGEGTRIAVCGPPKMWEDMKTALLSLGHEESALIELKALTDLQLQEQQGQVAKL